MSINWLGNSAKWSDPSQWGGGVLPGTADIANFGSGTYDVTFDTTATIAALGGGPSSATLDITAGALTLLDTSGNSNWSGTLSQEGGSLVVASGTLTLNDIYSQTGGSLAVGLGARVNLPGGTVSLGGNVDGLGTLGVGGTATLEAGSLGIGEIAIASTGTVALGADQVMSGALVGTGGSILTDGFTLTLSGVGSVVNSQLLGNGTLAISGSAFLGGLQMHGSPTVVDAGTIVADGMNVGNGVSDAGTLSVLAGAVLDLRADSTVYGDNTSPIENAGLMVKSQGAYGQRSNVQAPVVNTGTLQAAMGTLLLTNSGTGTLLGGTLDGAGVLDIGGNATLAAGAVVNVATLSVTFGGTLTLAGNVAPTSDVIVGLGGTLALAGNTLTLPGQGAFVGPVEAQGTAGNPGSLILAGTHDFNNVAFTGGTLWLEDAGLITESGYVTLGATAADHVAFQIDAGATYHIISDSIIYSFNNGSTIDAGILNNGLFWYDSGGGTTSNVDSAFANNNGGTILVSKGSIAFTQSFINDGTMLVDGSASFAGGAQASTGHLGTISIAPTGTVAVTGAVNASETINFDGAGGNLIVNTPSAFGGTIAHFGAGDTIDVAVHANSWVESAGTVTLLYVMNGTTDSVGTLAGAFVPGFGLTEDGKGGTYVYGAAPGNTFAGVTFSPVPYDTAVPNGGTLEWNQALDWSLNGTPTGGTIANIDSNTTTVVYGQDPLGQSSGTVEALFTPSSPVTLDMGSGDLTVLDYQSGWGGPVFQTGGQFESVTGLNIGGSTYELGASARLLSDSGRLSVSNTTFDVSGQLAGAGTIQANGTMIIEPTAVVSVATLVAGGQGVAVFNGSYTLTNAFEFDSQLSLTGGTLTLEGKSRLDGTMITPGTIAVLATADISNFSMQATADLLAISGTAIETSSDVSATLNGAISVAAGATYDLQSDNGVFLHAGTGELVNSGLFEKSGGTGTSIFEAQVTSTGTLAITTGTISMSYGAMDLAGTVEGGGALLGGNFNSNITTTLEPGLQLDVATLSLDNVLLNGDQSYAGNFTSAGTVTLQGHTLTLGGLDEIAGTVAGSGTVDLQHTADLNGLSVTGPATVVNVDGFVSQSGGVVLGGTSTDVVTLAIGPGGTYDQVNDQNIGGLFGSTVAGTIANAGLFEKMGGSINGGSSVVYAELVNTGAVLVNQGNLVLHGAAVNDGTMTVNGTLTTQGALGADAGQSGTIVIGPAGTLVANAAIAADQTITYDPGGLIELGQPGGFAATIAGFVPGDRIEILNNTAITGASYANGVISLTAANNSVLATLAVPGLGNPAGLTVSSDGTNAYVSEVACFAEGTRLLGEGGEVAVEALRPGERLVGVLGRRLRPVRWVGWTEVDLDRHPRAEGVAPILVAAGAVAPGVPYRDLVLSPDHALYLDGALVPVQFLVNGASIRRLPASGRVRYFHVELDAHDVVLAEGVAAESYLDTGNRGMFRNAGGVVELRPEFALAAWSERGCAPLLQGGAQLDGLHRRLLGRAAALGYRMTDAADLAIVGPGGVLAAERVAAGRWRVALPAGTASVLLRSRAMVPRALDRGSEDGRRLGVAVAEVRLDGVALDLESAVCGAGFHALEQAGDAAWRWTDGAAVLHLPAGAVLELALRPGGLRYWTEATPGGGGSARAASMRAARRGGPASAKS